MSINDVNLTGVICTRCSDCIDGYIDCENIKCPDNSECCLDDFGCCLIDQVKTTNKNSNQSIVPIVIPILFGLFIIIFITVTYIFYKKKICFFKKEKIQQSQSNTPINISEVCVSTTSNDDLPPNYRSLYYDDQKTQNANNSTIEQSDNYEEPEPETLPKYNN